MDAYLYKLGIPIDINNIEINFQKLVFKILIYPIITLSINVFVIFVIFSLVMIFESASLSLL